MIIDSHTHAFPDALAPRAIKALQDGDQVRACLDGTIGSLLASMDRAGIARSVVASIATKPEQFSSILRWSSEIASDRVVPFPSVHPADTRACDHLSEIAAAGFKGIKLHPYYQDFVLDDERIVPILEQTERAGLVLLLHAGFDIAFERRRIADPRRIAWILKRFPNLRLIAAHLGGWEDWEEVEIHLLGHDVYLDISYSVPSLGPERARALLDRHDPKLVLFGSDSPWAEQANALDEIAALDLPSRREACLLGENAEELLGL